MFGKGMPGVSEYNSLEIWSVFLYKPPASWEFLQIGTMMKLHIGMKVWIGVLSMILWSACATDEPEGKAVDGECESDEECSAGTYCGAAGECVQDCDPTSTDVQCDTGESCTADGRCVVLGECTDSGDCDSPPSTSTCDGDVRVGFEAIGECVDGGEGRVCDYSEERTPCDFGCSAGACNADPCDGVSCNAPPAATCDGDTRVSFESQGICVDGGCDYVEERQECAAGCTNGVCNTSQCDSVTCDTPPADRCDEDTAVTYAATGSCDDSTGAAICNYAPIFEGCLYTGASCDNAACVDPITQVGGVVIVEYMADPDDGFIDQNEWFEIVNVSGDSIDLTGWTIRSRGSQSDEVHVIEDNAETVVPDFADGDRLVFARRMGATGSVAVDYVYRDVSLANNTDWLQLENTAGEIVDYIYYEPGTIIEGRSRKLNPATTPTADANDDFAAWCPSLDDSESYTADPPNYGTPGAANSQCQVDPCADWTCERPEDFCLASDSAIQYQQDTAQCEVTRFSNPRCDFMAMEVLCGSDELCASGVCEEIPANLPNQGDVIFTEIMGDPSEVSDANGEWFELYNTTGADVSLFSVVFEDNESGGRKDSYTILDPTAVVPAQGYIVFARNTDSAVNGGIVDAFEYTGSHLKNTVDPDTFKIRLALQDGTVIAEPYYGPVGSGDKVPTGASLQLDAGVLDAAGQSDPTNWCAATATYGDGDRGTPGMPNESCE